MSKQDTDDLLQQVAAYFRKNHLETESIDS